MQRIDDPSNTPAVPSPLATVSPGYFRRPSILAGDQGTIVTADFLNDVQENIVQVILDAGLTLAKGTGTKLRDAIAAKIATHLAVPASEGTSAHVRMATAAEVLAQGLGTVAISPLRLKEAFVASVANPGFLKIPTTVGNLVLNFGRLTIAGDTTVPVTFAQPFATAELAHFATIDISGGTGVVAAASAWPDGTTPLTVVRVRNDTGNSSPVSWLSIGI